AILEFPQKKQNTDNQGVIQYGQGYFQREFLTMPGLSRRLPTTIWHPSCRTICTPLFGYVRLIVSGFIFSNVVGLGEEKLAFSPFIFINLAGLRALPSNGHKVVTPFGQFVCHPHRSPTDLP